MFESMDIFATVVEQSSLNQASRVLNLSQPALSRKIKGLEEELGVALFERKGKRLELTQIGQMTYEFALELRQAQRKYLQALSKFKTSGKSSITIGASLTTLQSTLPDLITLYTRYDPETDIKAVTGKTHEIVSLVKDRKVDIGLVASKIEERTLNCLPLFDDHLCLVLPLDHALTKQAAVNINHLHNVPMILFSKGTWYRILTDDFFSKYAITPEIKMEIDSFEAIIRLVSTCHVATLLPKSYLRDNLLSDNDLTVMNVPELMQTIRTTSLIFGEWSSLNNATLQLIQQAKQHFLGG